MVVGVISVIFITIVRDHIASANSQICPALKIVSASSKHKPDREVMAGRSPI